jgi:hypothetical protein
MTLMMVPSDALPAMGAVSALGAGFGAGQEVQRGGGKDDGKSLPRPADREER